MNQPKSQVVTTPGVKPTSDTLKRESGVLVYSSSLRITDPKTGQVLVQMRCS